MLLPETSGVSLESMDVIFGAVTKEEREAEIARRAVELEGRTLDEEEKHGAEHLEHFDEKEKERV